MSSRLASADGMTLFSMVSIQYPRRASESKLHEELVKHAQRAYQSVFGSYEDPHYRPYFRDGLSQRFSSGRVLLDVRKYLAEVTSQKKSSKT
ncbi:unnamed protein product [Strongylus vulgaris]|uniref:Uncharacterized protein n=1 Tax=Strongylus vulgaris TaxID=40348 RepID=A0A3P7JFW6_STRVU|nr:unnamed protein product [Strongylus vulgaris]